MIVKQNFPTARANFTALICLVLALFLGGCAAASRNAEPGRPRPGDAPYPVVLSASAERREQALANWTALARGDALSKPPAPELQPVTETLGALPATLNAPLLLPRVGGAEGKTPTEEETRESLRRFIASAAPLLGVVPSELSLVERTDNPDGTRRARYQQNPFDLPLRGGFGNLQITYTTDRRIVGLSSTAIPDTERLRRALTTVRQQQTLTADKVLPALAGRAVTFTDASGSNPQTYAITPSDQLAVRELVVYPVRPTSDPSMLELHLAWEVAVEGQGTPLLIYIDAVRGEQLGATHAPPQKKS